jgi:hypothetical protein
MEHEERPAHHENDVGEVPQHDEVGQDAIEHRGEAYESIRAMPEA